MSAELESVVIFDEVLFKPGGQVHRWMSLLCKHFEEHAIAAAPERSGELRAGITSEAHPFGFKQMQGTIASDAPHTMYVLRGTGHPVRGRAGNIYATKGFGDLGSENPGMRLLWGYVDPETKKFTRRATKGSKRKQHWVRLKGHYMAFGPDEWGPRVIAFSVSGQEPNNFLFTAWRATARTHPSIRGLAPTASIVDF